MNNQQEIKAMNTIKAAAIAGVIALASSIAHAQTVTFSNVNDAVPEKYFDSATSVVDPINPNKLLFGFNTGVDPQTWVYNTFTASTAAFYRASAMDTMSFVIQAPAGYYVSKITYTQRGDDSITRTGEASGGSQWVVANDADDLGLFGTNPNLTKAVDLTGQNMSIVPVSITTGLFVFSTPQLGAATLSVTSADVVVEVLPLP